jgi:GDP-4-dehydro-6-deoxy-D-mannose reductase
MKYPSVFITGITGFVGSHMADLCLEKNLEVSGTYLFENELENIEHLKENIDLFLCNITDEDQMRALLKRKKPDFIFHLAAKSHVGFSWIDRKDTLSINFMGTITLLEAVRELTLKPRLLMVGSAEEYGKVQSSEPITEDYPLKPTSPYAVSKAASEMLGYQYCLSDAMDIIMVRAFNHTGPRQHPSFVCSDFARQIARIEAKLEPPLINVGNLEVYRDFSDVRDVSSAYFKLLEKGTSAEVYNVCSGKAVSIKNVLCELLDLSSMKIDFKVDKDKFREVDLPILVGDNTKIKTAIGCEPIIPLRKTLEDLLNYWRSKVSIKLDNL